MLLVAMRLWETPVHIPNTMVKTQAPWLILGATMLGNGGVFCWYSYISPLLTQVSGFSAESLTVLMVLAGFGMVDRKSVV